MLINRMATLSTGIDTQPQVGTKTDASLAAACTQYISSREGLLPGWSEIGSSDVEGICTNKSKRGKHSIG